jgi:hypothetical protein
VSGAFYRLDVPGAGGNRQVMSSPSGGMRTQADAGGSIR